MVFSVRAAWQTSGGGGCWTPGDAQSRTVAALRSGPARIRVTKADFVGVEPEQFLRGGVQTRRQRHDPVLPIRRIRGEPIHGVQAVVVARLTGDDEAHPFGIKSAGTAR